MANLRNGQNRRTRRFSGSAACQLRAGVRERRADDSLNSACALVSSAVKAWELHRGIPPTVFHR